MKRGRVQLISIWHIVVVVIVQLCAIGGCGTENNSDVEDESPSENLLDDDLVDDDGGVSTDEIFFEDFDSYEVGDMSGTDWTAWFQSGASYMSIVEDIQGNETKMLKISGGLMAGSEIGGKYEFNYNDTKSIEITFEIYPVQGSYFAFNVFNSANTIIQLEYLPESVMLNAAVDDFIGVECIECPSEIWSSISIEIYIYEKRYSVFLNGELTECENFELLDIAELPIAGIGIWESAVEGYGGYSYFDNIQGSVM